MANDVRFSPKHPVWKGDGVYEGSFENSKAGMFAAQGNYSSGTVPLFAQLPPDATHPEPYFEEIPDKALYRGPHAPDMQRRYIATVSNQFQPVQHHEVADALMSIPNDWPLSMVGLTGKHNTKMFWGYDAGTHDLLGKSSEQIQRWIYISNANDGGSSLHMLGTMVRMGCFNQYPLAMKEASFYIRLRHGANALTDVKQWTKYFHRLQHGMDVEILNQERMAKTKITMEQYKTGLLHVWSAQKPRLVEEWGEEGRPGMPDQVLRAQSQYANLLERTEVYRLAAERQYEELNDTAPHIAGTAYAAFNSVTYLENWRVGRGGEGAVESAIFGERAKTMQRAHSVFLGMSS